MDCLFSRPSSSGAPLTILGSKWSKTAKHADGMGWYGLTDILGGLLINAISTLVLLRFLGLAK